MKRFKIKFQKKRNIQNKMFEITKKYAKPSNIYQK